MDGTYGGLVAVAGLLAVAGTLAWRASERAEKGKPWVPRIRDDQGLARVLERIARKHRQPAIAAALVQGDRIVVQAAAGRVVEGDSRLVEPRSRFHVGSTTKGMTALLIAILVREGRLRYDATLGSLLPDVPMRDAYRAVTVRDLLVHRGGILPMQDTTTEDPAVVERLWRELPARVADPRLQRLEMARVVLDRLPTRASRGHVYSNVGYALLGLAAERAGGDSFEALMASRVFGPLGMKGSRVGGWPASQSEPDQPRGHYVEARSLRAQPLDDEYVFPAWMNPAGGVHCAIEDFARYARECLRGLQGQGALLDRDGYQEMHAIQADVRVREMYAPSLERLKAAYGSDPGDGSTAIGHGWVIVPTPNGPMSVGDGSGGTFFARVVVYPALDAAFVAATSSGHGAPAIAAVIRDVTGLIW